MDSESGSRRVIPCESDFARRSPRHFDLPRRERMCPVSILLLVGVFIAGLLYLLRFEHVDNLRLDIRMILPTRNWEEMGCALLC